MGIRAIRSGAAGLLALALAACASSSVLVGNAREAIEPEQVKIYLEPPAGHETVALLEASDLGANGFSAQSRMNKVINRLKAEAADLGANGILLQGFDTQYTGSVGTGYGTATFSGNSAYGTGVGFSAAQYSKVGRAIAIYVPDTPSAPVATAAAAIVPPTAAAPQTAPAPASVPVPQAGPTPPTPAAAPAPATSSPTNQTDWRKWGQKGG